MASLDINQLKVGEKLADQWDHLVGNILAARSADEECGLQEPHLPRVLEGEVAEVVEGLGQDVQRHAELLRLAVGRAVQVAEKELADMEVLFLGLAVAD